MDFGKPFQITQQLKFILLIATLKYVLPRHSIDIAVGGVGGLQVCFYRWLFADPFKPLRACGGIAGH